MQQLQTIIEPLGYVAGRETSLLITDGREPDVSIQYDPALPTKSRQLDYNMATAQILAVPGLMVEWDVRNQHAIFIREGEQLVTVIEFVPSFNKVSPKMMAAYQERRLRLLERDVNVIEIDLTRSYTHLIESVLLESYAYHIAVYIPGEIPLIIGVDFDKPLPRIAIPLRQEVVPLELQSAYDLAYHDLRIATHILNEGHYTDQHLPFPTTLTSAQRQHLRMTVDAWQAELKRLLEHKTE